MPGINPLQRGRRQRRGAMPAAAASVILAVIHCSSPTATAQDEAPPAEAADDVGYYQSILLSDATEDDTRTQTAGRLLAVESEASYAALAEALRSGDPRVVRAVVRAAERVGRPPTQLLDASIDALVTGPAETVGGVSRHLARYGTPARDRLAARAQDVDAELDARIRAIGGLAWFREKPAASALMAILHAGDDPPGMLVDAVCESLARLTAADDVDGAEGWRAWWHVHGQGDGDDWMRGQVARLSARIARLENDARAHEQAVTDVERRLSDTLRDLFPSLPRPEQMDRLPALLEDDLVSVREFAMNRVDVFQRDAVKVSDAVRDRLYGRIDDPVPALRVRATQLLSDLVAPELGARVATRLETETDPAVVAVLLDVLQRQAVPTAAPTIRAWLTDAALGVAAADALWRIVVDAAIPAEQLDATRADVHAALDTNRSPALVRLRAVLADDADLNDAWLDEGEPAYRGAAAQGFIHRGRVQPVIDRGADPALRPYAIGALRDGPANLDTIRRLVVELAPNNGDHGAWSTAVLALCSRASSEAWVDIDDLVAAHVDTALRASILEQFARAATDGDPPPSRPVVVTRLARLLIDLDRANDALAFLTELNGSSDDPEIARLRFAASLATGDYDAAALQSDDPLLWIEALHAQADRGAEQASALRDQIEQRFAEQLSGDIRVRFDEACSKLVDAVDTDDPMIPLESGG